MTVLGGGSVERITRSWPISGPRRGGLRLRNRADEGPAYPGAGRGEVDEHAEVPASRSAGLAEVGE